MTIRDAIAQAAQRLTGASIDAPRATAQLLLAHLLGKDRTYILTHPDEVLEATILNQFHAWVRRRISGVPLQYLTGHQEFYGLDFMVTPDVLIPRPETELMVEQVLSLNHKPAPRIIDVGTGSGCLAVTLAAKLPRAALIALDISEPALRLARLNARRHGVADRIRFLVSDLLSGLIPGTPGSQADFIVANPPYVSAADFDELAPEVRDHEPRLALLAGGDGLRVHRRLLSQSAAFLRSDGALILEIGCGQQAALSRIIRSSTWHVESVAPDLQGIPRVLVLRSADKD